jgi:SRSO17 transposase
VAVSVSIANRGASLPVAWRLYLPQDWAEDPERLARAGVPQEIGFATKPEIALMQIRSLKAAGVPEGVVLMNAGHGVDTALREAIAALDLDYVAGVQSHMTVPERRDRRANRDPACAVTSRRHPFRRPRKKLAGSAWLDRSAHGKPVSSRGRRCSSLHLVWCG